MPKLSGLDATELIRNSSTLYAQIPIVALTAHAIKGVKEECLGKGMNAYVSKPIDYDYLFEVLSEIKLKKIPNELKDRR